MMRPLLVLLGAFALLTAATATAQGTKWHPGHYVLLDGGGTVEQHALHIAQLRDVTTIQGFMIRFQWYSLEPAFNEYDFSRIDAYLAMLRQLTPTKRLVVRIVDRRFATTVDANIVPDYLREVPIYNGGVVRSRTGYVARLWEEPVMSRLVSLYQALAQRYDSEPLFEGAFTEETTLSLSEPFPPGYSHELLAEQYVRFVNAVKPMMPTSNLFLNANWLGTPIIVGDLIQDVRDARVGAGGSNVFPGRLTHGQSVLTGVYGADYRLELPIANGVENGDFGGEGEFTPEDIGTHAYDVLHSNYVFWIRKTSGGTPAQQWFTGILPYLRSAPPIHTRCPNIYGICVSDDGPAPVDPVNQPPAVSAGADTSSRLPEGTVTLGGSVTHDGLPGPSVTIAWTQVTGPQPAVFTDAGSPTSQVGFSSAGTYVLRLTASDGELSASDEVSITVGPANQPPQVDAGSDASIQLPTVSVTLAGTATDDGVPSVELSLEWLQVSGPSSALFTAADAPSTVATFSSAGTYVLRLTAHDGELSASDEVTVTVNAAPPSPAPPPSGGGGGNGGAVTSTPDPAPAPSTGSSGGGGLGLLELLLLGVISFARALGAGGNFREVGARYWRRRTFPGTRLRS